MAAPDFTRGGPRRRGARHSPERSDRALAFGAVIRELRRAQELTQEALAEAAGFHLTYISLLERGLRTPTLTVIIRLADALRIQAAQLVERTMEKYTQRRTQ